MEQQMAVSTTISFLSFIGLVGVQVSAQGGASTYCPQGYTPYKDSCYGYVDHKMNWADAEATCTALGGFLAEVFSAEVNNFLQNMSRLHGSHEVWLGGDDLIKEGQWSWARSGVPILEFTDWYPGQPEQKSQDEENCLEMNVDHFGGHWNDDQCDNEQRFICQRLSEAAVIG